MSQSSFSRVRTRIVLPTSSARPRGTGAPKTLARVVLSDSFLVLGSACVKEFLFLRNTGVFWVTAVVLLWGALISVAHLIKDIKLFRRTAVQWSLVGLVSVFLFIQVASFITTLGKLSLIRTVYLTQMATDLSRSALSGYLNIRRATISLVLFGLAFLSEPSGFKDASVGYIATAVYASATTCYDYATGSVYSPAVDRGLRVFGVIGSAILGLPLYFVTHSWNLGHLTAGSPISYLTPLILSYPLFQFIPSIPFNMRMSFSKTSFVILSFLKFPICVAISILSGSKLPTWVDIVILSLFTYVLIPRAIRDQRSKGSGTAIRLARSYLKRITTNPESSKIFYFLMLNLAFMLVQMVYGVWTNSLGLISDAVHMAFDCMAIGVGLFASVMATWSPNEQFTYGYGRVETLSGFANGIFLILISIFIVFEAIDRIINPPDMDTSQLLLVSSIGLGVNLFGMFAMGGHHHGHSHSHGHTHTHTQSHSHSHTNESPSHSVHYNADHSLHSHSHSPIQNEPGHSHYSGTKTDTSPLTEEFTPDAAPSPQYAGGIDSPFTPSYEFGRDQHFESHHHSHHTANVHDHDHSVSRQTGRSHNMRGVFLHVMADTLGSVGVIISTLLIQYYGWTGFDPIASLLIAILIVASVIPLVIDSGKVLALDVGNADPMMQSALADLITLDGVSGFTMARLWPKDSSSYIGSIHIQVSGLSEKLEPILDRVDSHLRRRVTGLEELTIQVERTSGHSL